ncbi:hypothetical protein ACMAZF_14970 [Psychrobium sp. nBUS_13]|uniref:hypothetical protein n=1 Tax=Psychrobium sp. nBUS_13 TaxID=3395319 RepID=UPI003EBA3D57
MNDKFYSLVICDGGLMNRVYGILILLLTTTSFAEELDENRGPIEYVHSRMHNSVKVYVVTYQDVVKGTWAKGAGDKIDITAKIINVLKGDGAVGDYIHFNKYLDGRYGNTDRFIGKKYIVFYEKFGDVIVGPSQAGSTFEYTEERYQYLLNHE